MTDYKNTLNLPGTAFPMKANLAQREPDTLAFWQEKKIYRVLRSIRQGSERFVLHDGPPYANGHLHCGHALNKILKDIIVKSQSLWGKDAPFVPGWDCHGLPIELNVEKKYGKAGDKLTPAAFRQQCRAYARSQIEIQREEFKRIGVFGDWEKPYATSDFDYEANIIRALAKIIENGHLEQGFKPVHWCIACGSALAEAEVEYQDKTSPAIDVAFKMHHPEDFLKKHAGQDAALKPVIVPIWTTTPWTLPANEAVCLHPEMEYALLATADAYYIVAQALVEVLQTRFLKGAIIQKTLMGRVLEGLSLQHPFLDKIVPVIAGEHVTMDAGTGCVHTAPAHGMDDYLAGKSYALPMHNPVAPSGCFLPEIPYLAGVHVLKANDIVLNLLIERDALLHAETIVHSYPHCWRHKTPMIFLATPQWFIAMDKNGLREQVLQAIKTVQWVPEWGMARIAGMVASRPDWCISRQRNWGTPIPLFVHQSTRALHPDTLLLLEKVALAVEEGGIERWFDTPIESWLSSADAAVYEKVTDTLDVWFDAGVSHYSVLRQHPDLQVPADVVLEGTDQHRGWFNAAITTSVAMFGTAPYKTVVTHGYTLDVAGNKLSKSQGNYIALDKFVEKHGADVVRLWIAASEFRHDVHVSDEIMKRTSEAYRRIRNTARFLLANLDDFDPMQDLVPADQLLQLDALAVARMYTVQDEIMQAYETFQFHIIYQKIYHFCNIDLGSFYLDVIKDRQYTAMRTSRARRSCQTALYHIIQAFVRWIAPILSFTAEEIWQYIPGEQKQSVFLTRWYMGATEVQTHCDVALWHVFQSIRDAVNIEIELKRQTGALGSSLEADVVVYAMPREFEILARLGDELHFLLITSQASLAPWDQAPEGLQEHAQSGVCVTVTASMHSKCERCWHRLADVGAVAAHPTLCARCIANIETDGADRYFV